MVPATPLPHRPGLHTATNSKTITQLIGDFNDGWSSSNILITDSLRLAPSEHSIRLSIDACRNHDLESTLDSDCVCVDWSSDCYESNIYRKYMSVMNIWEKPEVKDQELTNSSISRYDYNFIPNSQQCNLVTTLDGTSGTQGKSRESFHG